MPLFRSSRKKPNEPDPAEALLREVGGRLRQVRMERGEELEDVAQSLRIRPTYLYGLEQGDLAVVPGRTYALGFLRSYARYLGFDGDDLIAQIRSSVSQVTGKTRLHVRSPLPESRLPKMPIVVLSLAVLAGIYVGWSYVEHSSRAVVEVVAEVPEELQQLVPDPDPEPAQAPPVQPEPSQVGQEQADGAIAVAAPAPDLATDPVEEVSAAEAAVPSQADEAEIAASEPEAPEPEAGPAAAPELPSAAKILAGLEPVAAGGEAVPAIYGDEQAEPRVILRARSRTWLQVSSKEGDYLWVDTLEPGDAFVVPDRPDLVLWTGNAGGLEVIVDGTPLAPLGPDASVVRDVSLRPEALLRRLRRAPAADAAPDR